MRLPGLHGMDIGSAVDLSFPTASGFSVVVVGVQPKDCSAGEALSEEVGRSIPKAVEAVVAEISSEGPGRVP